MENSNPQEIKITQDQAKAVNILIAAAGVAQKAGAFSLQDAKTVFEAVQQFAPPASAEEATETSEEEAKTA